MITYELALFLGGISLLIFLVITLIYKIKLKKAIIVSIFIIYLTAVVSITLFPILIEEKVEYFGDITWYNFIPFKTIIGMFSEGINTTSIVQFCGNICMTIPFGVIIMYLINNTKWLKFLLISFIFSVSIEFAQLIIGLIINNMYRTVDIDDIILNVLGAFIGFGIYKLFQYYVKLTD
ncbi:MAG: VanZ family protein [Acutalibacteraceae bacterium]|nr:VanZ family protein [Acutalibacteraceae bacterium]